MSDKNTRLIIGITPCWMHEDRERTLYNGRPLLYLEQSMGSWLMSHGELVPMLIPASGISHRRAVDAGHFIDQIDGLVVQGGVDMAPSSYGAAHLDAEQWPGDPVRDAHELELVRRCVARDVPVLGICRGHQVLNVAFGGTLYQDLSTEVGDQVRHRDSERYHRNSHAVEFVEGAGLARRFGKTRGQINSVHHQAVRDLGHDLEVEARCPEDGVIEAIRYTGDAYALGVQWHPEFQEPGQHDLLPAAPVLQDFVDAIWERSEPARALESSSTADVAT